MISDSYRYFSEHNCILILAFSCLFYALVKIQLVRRLLWCFITKKNSDLFGIRFSNIRNFKVFEFISKHNTFVFFERNITVSTIVLNCCKGEAKSMGDPDFWTTVARKPLRPNRFR